MTGFLLAGLTCGTATAPALITRPGRVSVAVNMRLAARRRIGQDLASRGDMVVETGNVVAYRGQLPGRSNRDLPTWGFATVEKRVRRLSHSGV